MAKGYKAFEKYELKGMFDTVVKQTLLKFLLRNSTKELSILEIRDGIGLPESSISNSLKALRELGVVECREEGKYTYCKLNRDYVERFEIIYRELDEVYQMALSKRTLKRGRNDT